jgi:hypothetical protein
MNVKTKSTIFGNLVALSLLMLCAIEADADEQDLARASQNPVADMISLPMKNKFNFGMGDEDAFGYELELQPVYPVNLGGWNLINRFIVPVTYREAPYEGMDDTFGLRDITYQAFFSPAEAGKVIWGIGPTMIIPTHTDDTLGNDKWAIGPAALALTMRGPWVSGVLAQHFWDFAGDNDAANVNLSTLQYFINLQHPGLLPQYLADHKLQLGGRQRRGLDHSGRRWSRKSYALWRHPGRLASFCVLECGGTCKRA